MAEKRFIARRITESDKIRILANEGKLLATSVYMWLLPYTDRAGRINANAYYLKGGIFQGYGFTLEELTAAIDDLARVGLVHLYSNGRHDRIIQYAKFHVDDGGFNKPHEREAASTFPGPDDAGSVSITTMGTGTHEERGKVPDKVRDEVPDPATTPPRRSPEELELELELEVELENNPPTPQKPETLPPPDVEAPPRRAQARTPTSKTKNTTKAPPGFDPAAVTLPDFVSPDVWRDFVDHRRKLRKILTQRAVELVLADLAKTPLDADEMLRTSIKRGWTGVFPLDSNKTTTRTPTNDPALEQYRKRGL